jgi:hypothetical protein
MKIINLDQFIALPAGTVFAKYKPCYFEDLCIKGDSILETKDFFYQDIVGAIDAGDSGEWSDLLFKSQETGASLAMDFQCQGRDGCFEADQLFAVWERQDVQSLITRLGEALTASAESDAGTGPHT